MFRILVLDHPRRTLWLYNTWRHQIATGDFVVMVSAMISALAIGTTLFPGAGTVAGFFFGLAGGGRCESVRDAR